jgi:hypothetical protein
MIKGTIEKIFTGELIVSYTEYLDNGKKLYQELPIHPYYKHYLFQVGQEINFHYIRECSLHYPTDCRCTELTLYALPIFQSNKKNFFDRLLKFFKFKF